MNNNKSTLLSLIAVGVLSCSAAHAAVTSAEAEKLKTELTPMGGERAGNADGSIPAWTGGQKDPLPAGKLNRPPLFNADEKALLKIDSSNVEKYKDKLSDGEQALLKNIPGYTINVYPTHRTALAPEHTYERVFKNATTTKMDDRELISDWNGSIPFPIPKSGSEAMANTQFAFRGIDVQTVSSVYVVSGSAPVLATSTVAQESMPGDYPPGREDPFKGQTRYAVLVETKAPAYQAGEKILGLIDKQLNAVAQAWTYLPGQRRLRRTPNVQYDVPSPFTSGVTNYDEQNGFQGSIDRYDWKVVGKKELYVPYNNNNFLNASGLDQVLKPNSANSDLMRWELHRTWVIEGTLKAGQRHVVPKRRVYVDEDSWQILLADHWDAKGSFWKATQILTYVNPTVPGMIVATNFVYNIQSKSYAAFNVLSGEKDGYTYREIPAATFSPRSLEASGVR
ncbi:DUF1329 domain-containing protein [Pseudomonas sp. UL073]|uniref:DUF1329 domain-containing protein n=1 Tax=Zestomonas insulae TaxID=2809017 RepID=A0ABS2IGQ9_9GAMM|nr:DUF1329 domain-containing protein [Pseudomonas insulae]MBM7061023.1 DUF1329 domain-containing protein [Pseudomonas insulae]